MTQKPVVWVIGGGLAGSEAAWQAAQRGVHVLLFEMRPVRKTPVHQTDRLAELVCSNSLKAVDPLNAHGLLKKEMLRLGSLILEAALQASLPGGKALVVDREIFANIVTEKIEQHPDIEIIRQEVTELPNDQWTVVATGPLTSDALAEHLKTLTGEESLAFYDAISPIVSADSLDFDRLFFQDRHGWDHDSYLNAPMSKEEYERFVEALRTAEIHEPHFDEKIPFFEGCLPIEEMARRGLETLRYGPLRPVGLKDPRTGETPYAVVQLRPENRDRTAYSLVGFQTRLKIPEQRRVFRMIPGLEHAEFLRYGAIHRNTYLKSPKILQPTLQLRDHPQILIAGQLVGTEGYTEAAMGGLLAGINVARLAQGQPPVVPPLHTMMGALIHYITTVDPKHFQPMNANFGLILDVPKRMKKLEKKRFIVRRALEELEQWIRTHSLTDF